MTTHLASLLGHRVHLLGILRAEHRTENRCENSLRGKKREKKIVRTVQQNGSREIGFIGKECFEFIQKNVKLLIAVKVSILINKSVFVLIT